MQYHTRGLIDTTGGIMQWIGINDKIDLYMEIQEFHSEAINILIKVIEMINEDSGYHDDVPEWQREEITQHITDHIVGLLFCSHPDVLFRAQNEPGQGWGSTLVPEFTREGVCFHYTPMNKKDPQGSVFLFRDEHWRDIVRLHALFDTIILKRRGNPTKPPSRAMMARW